MMIGVIIIIILNEQSYHAHNWDIGITAWRGNCVADSGLPLAQHVVCNGRGLRADR